MPRLGLRLAPGRRRPGCAPLPRSLVDEAGRAHRLVGERPGGRLSLCDFVPARHAVPLLLLQPLLFDGYVRRWVGPTDVSCTRARYLQLAAEAGFALEGDADVTANMLPTYPVLRRLAEQTGTNVATAKLATWGLEWLGRLGALRYLVLSFVRGRIL